MRRLAVAAILAAFTAPAVPAAAGEGPPPSVVASPARAGTRPVTLTLKLHYEMVCGRPGKGPLVVTLPRAMRVPRTIGRTAVLLQGKAPTSVRVDGRVVTIGVPVPTGISCFSITMGTLTTTFTRRAQLGTPRAPGTYAVLARIGSRSFTARLAVGTEG